MQYSNLRTEYLLFKEKKNVLALCCGELIFYHNNEEKNRWFDTEDIYSVIIKSYNEKNPQAKEKLIARINSSLTYLTFKALCSEYGE